jgi:hypothetical protein
MLLGALTFGFSIVVENETLSKACYAKRDKARRASSLLGRLEKDLVRLNEQIKALDQKLIENGVAVPMSPVRSE